MEPAPAEPSPIAGMGYHQAFRDDFDTLNRGVWDDHIWAPTAAPTRPGPPSRTAENGVLHLRTSRSFTGSGGDPYPINTVTTQTSGKTFQYGYFEARMKWSAGHGAWPGFWLMSYQHAIDEDRCKTQAGEIDVMEGQGSEPHVFYGTVHSNTNGCAPEDDQNANNYQPVDDRPHCRVPHLLGALDCHQISWYLDGKLIMSATSYATRQPADVPPACRCGPAAGLQDPVPSTPDVLETQVDWVSVWQK